MSCWPGSVGSGSTFVPEAATPVGFADHGRLHRHWQNQGRSCVTSIPIIAVTSYALSGEEKKARAAGCDDYVPKPFSPRQLLAKIRQYLLQRLTSIAAPHMSAFGT